MMNLKFKPWILAGIIRHNHSFTDFQATDTEQRDRLRSMQNVTDGIWHEKGWFWKGEGEFWLVFIITWLYCPINNKGAKIKFIWKSVGIHLFVNIRAGGLYFSFLAAASILSKIPCSVFVTFNVLALTCDNEWSKNCRYKKEWNRWAPISFAN